MNLEEARAEMAAAAAEMAARHEDLRTARAEVAAAEAVLKAARDRVHGLMTPSGPVRTAEEQYGHLRAIVEDLEGYPPIRRASGELNVIVRNGPKQAGIRAPGTDYARTIRAADANQIHPDDQHLLLCLGGAR